MSDVCPTCGTRRIWTSKRNRDRLVEALITDEKMPKEHAEAWADKHIAVYSPISDG